MEKNLNFDKIINRKNTKSIKYDFAKKWNMSEDLLPLWVADMDFQTSSFIQEALENQVKHGIFGYSDGQEEYFEIVKKWMKKHYKWDVKEEWMVKTPGVVFAIAMAVRAFTNEGDKILIQQPVYYPFGAIIKDNNRVVVSSNLVPGEDNKYHMDFEDFENKVVNENIKLFILCNPHNPVGRVWSRDELIKLGDICYKYGVKVVSDEIHADFVFKGEHNVFAGLKKEYEDMTVTCTAPSKTFNLAGLQISNIFISDSLMKKKFQKEMLNVGYSVMNIMGIVACEAAYKYGETWYKAMHEYVRKNIAFTKDFLDKKIPDVTMTDHEGTYLVWLDFRKLGLTSEELEDLIIKKAGLWLDSGKIFGESGNGFQRINAACPRAVLEEALNRIRRAVDELKDNKEFDKNDNLDQCCWEYKKLV